MTLSDTIWDGWVSQWKNINTLCFLLINRRFPLCREVPKHPVFEVHSILHFNVFSIRKQLPPLSPFFFLFWVRKMAFQLGSQISIQLSFDDIAVIRNSLSPIKNTKSQWTRFKKNRYFVHVNRKSWWRNVCRLISACVLKKVTKVQFFEKNFSISFYAHV